MDGLSSAKHDQEEDPHCLYLLGVALKGLGKVEEACRVFRNSLRLFPWNWSCCLDYLSLVLDDNSSRPLPMSGDEEPADCVAAAFGDHWMGTIFEATLHLESQRSEEALGM